MSNIVTIPKGTDILDFLHELDGTNERTKNAWLIMHRSAVESLMEQSGDSIIDPALCLANVDCSFALHYKGYEKHIGAIAFRTAPCFDDKQQAPWFLVTAIYFREDAPIQIAFRHLSCYPSEAIFLMLEE